MNSKKLGDLFKLNEFEGWGMSFKLKTKLPVQVIISPL